MELREYARALGRHWPLMLLTVALTVGATAALTKVAAPTYRSSTVLFASSDRTNGDPDVVAQRLQSYLTLATGPRIATAVAARVSPPLTADQVRSKIDASIETGTALLTITATDSSPTRARDIAATAARELTDLATKLDPKPADSTELVRLSVAQPAETSRVPENRTRNLAFAGVLGLLLAAALTAAREALGATLRSAEDVRALAGVKPLGVLPRDTAGRGSRAVIGQRPNDPRAEALRKLRSVLRPVAPHEGPVSFLVTSSVRGEGTALTACGLAAALTEDWSRVALVDADLRTPSVHSYLDVGASPGLSDVLAGAATVEDVMRETVNRRLWVLPAGAVPANPGQLLAAPAMAEVVRMLGKGFDVVVVNAPPVLPVADAAVLSAVTSRVLLVVRAGRTRLDKVDRAVALLGDVDAHLVGAVLNTVGRSRRHLPRRLRLGRLLHVGGLLRLGGRIHWGRLIHFGRARTAGPAEPAPPVLRVEATTPLDAIALYSPRAIQAGPSDEAASDLGRHWKRTPIG